MVLVSSFKIGLSLRGGGKHDVPNFNHPFFALRNRIGICVLGHFFETGEMSGNARSAALCVEAAFTREFHVFQK
jgi:hypothetical protein